MTLKERIANLIARGAEQLSRKYRSIGVPPELPEGKTYLDLLREQYPRDWERHERRARSEIVRLDRSTHVTLTWEEFSEWLVQHKCKPLHSPPEPFATWAEYWDAKRETEAAEGA